MSKSEFIKRWFGYSRRERSGTYILATILLALLIVRFTRNSSYKTDISETVTEIESVQHKDGFTDTQNPEPILRVFDPNSASDSALMLLGLTKKQAGTIVNYRNSGGVFTSPEDFRKIYGISDEQKELLIGYIEIGDKFRSVKKKEDKASSKSGLSHQALNDSNRIGYLPYASDPLIELNSADSSDLLKIRGIGMVLSPRIIKYRNLLGGYYAIDQLNEVYGIDSSLVASLKISMIIDTSGIKKIDINRAEYIELLRHPYISREQTDLIVSYRKVAGKFSHTGELVINRIFTIEDYKRVKPYIYTGDDYQWP